MIDLKTPEPCETLGWLDHSDSSEAHAMCDCISGALEDVDQEDHVKTTIGMLEEFQEWAAAALKRLKKKKKKS